MTQLERAKELGIDRKTIYRHKVKLGYSGKLTDDQERQLLASVVNSARYQGKKSAQRRYATI